MQKCSICLWAIANADYEWCSFKVVVSGVATTPEEVATYAGCTLLAAECAALGEDGEGEAGDQQSTVTAAIKFLSESEFITLKTVKDAG